MRLKKLVITGFKSFAEKTVLTFEKGITCIVGPNGCGKSNIADAFRWVLGEQSAKSLRGHKMPDVIFAGASKRQSLNFAEVSITLSDIQGVLPVDYEEITITRRLHRSGESEYLLNSNLVRLKDIHSLLLDSGIGKNAFSIFEQGKIDQIINYSATDRRFIFEEAAGIVRFLVRKQEALKRLEQADLNLSRVSDIHLEVEKNLTILKGQAEKAFNYKNNQLKLKDLEKSSLALRWQVNFKKKNQFQQQVVGLKESWNKAVALNVAKGLEGQAIRKVLQENELKKEQHQILFYKEESAIAIQKNEMHSNSLRFEEYRKKAGKLKRDLEELNLAKVTRQSTLHGLRESYQKISHELEAFEKQLVNQESKVKGHEKAVIELRQQVQHKQQSYLKLIEHENGARHLVSQIEFNITNDTDRSQLIEKQLSQINLEFKISIQVSEEKKKHLQQLSDTIDAYKDRLNQIESELLLFTQQIEIQKKEFENKRKKNFELLARHKVLLKMQEEFEGFSIGSKQLMQASSDPQNALYSVLKPLYEFFKAEILHAEALSAILKPYSQTLVVYTVEEMKSVLQFAEKEDIQDFSLVCIEQIQNFALKQKNSGHAFFNEIEENLINRYFLQNVEVWENLSTPFQTTRLQEGWIKNIGYFDQRGVFFKNKINENQIFLREAELVQIVEEIAAHDKTLQHIEKSITQIQQSITTLQNTRLEIDSQLRRDEMKLVEVNFGLQKALADQERFTLQKHSFENEDKILQEKICVNQQSLEEKKLAYFNFKNELAQLKETLEALEFDLQTKEQILSSFLKDEKHQGLLYQQLMQDKSRLTHECQLIESKDQDFEMQSDRIFQELEDIEILQHTVETTNEKVKISLELQQSGMSILIEKGNQLNEENQKIKVAFAEYEAELVLMQEKAKEFEMQYTNMQIQLEHLSQLTTACQLEFSEKYHLDENEIVEYLASITLSYDQIEKQIRQLKQSLNDAGDVNLMAIEELEKHRVRHEFLAQQINDLDQTKQELMNIISQLDTESQRLFKETFELIRTNFQKNFAILFNGGEADLQFTDNSTPILEAGIEIIAKPPGKQMRSISLLSGGEKCLTAVALLFAIFEVKSSPFCILDEIDAPLDDTNIDRFVNVVRHFADRCQFLIITHNKRTMAISDTIFGVSMEEKGVSKLLSLEFSHEILPEVALI